MNNEDCKLIIEIYYNNKIFSLESDTLIDLNEIINQSIRHFNINNEFKKDIIFTYKDEEGDINIINNNEDIINSSIYIGSEKYLSKIFLDIIKEDKINSKDNNEKIDENKSIIENEEIKKLEDLNSFKDNKINELEIKIMKLEKEYRQLNNMKNINVLKLLKEENKFENNNNQFDYNKFKNEMKSLINDIIIIEREHFENKLKKFKDDLILDINTNLLKEKENKDNILKDISGDIAFIKEEIIKINKENKIIEDKINMKNNKLLVKRYICENCNHYFLMDDCFDIENNKYFDEHNFKLEKLDEKINKNNNIFKNEKELLNNKKIEINEELEKMKEKDYIYNKKEKEYKEKKDDKIEEEKIKENKDDKIVEEGKEEKKDENEKIQEKKEEMEEENEKLNEDNLDFEEDLNLQNILKNYFYNIEGSLKNSYPERKELKLISDYYKSIIEKKDLIQYYQDSFIAEVDEKKTDKKYNNRIFGINIRIRKIEELLQNLSE